MVNIKFLEGDTITIYGRFTGIVSKTYKDKTVDCLQISAYFIESGNTIKQYSNTESTTKGTSTNTYSDNNNKENKNTDTSKENKTNSEKVNGSNNKKSNNTSNNKEEYPAGYIKDGRHLGEEGKRQDEGTAYDPSQDIIDEDDNKGGAMDNEDGILYQYKDDDGNTIKEYENGDIITEYND